MYGASSGGLSGLADAFLQLPGFDPDAPLQGPEIIGSEISPDGEHITYFWSDGSQGTTFMNDPAYLAIIARQEGRDPSEYFRTAQQEATDAGWVPDFAAGGGYYDQLEPGPEPNRDPAAGPVELGLEYDPTTAGAGAGLGLGTVLLAAGLIYAATIRPGGR
jgi:hypothetical protein